MIQTNQLLFNNTIFACSTQHVTNERITFVSQKIPLKPITHIKYCNKGKLTHRTVYPPGVTAVADTVSSQDRQVSVKHNMSRSWSTTKSAKKGSLVADRSRIQQTQLGRSHVCGQHWDLYIIAPGRKWRLGQSWRTGPYYYRYLAWLMGTRTTAPMGGLVECHPCDARCSPGSIVQTVSAVQTALATMVAHDRITMSSVTQVQAEHLKCQQFMKPRTTCRELMAT